MPYKLLAGLNLIFISIENFTNPESSDPVPIKLLRPASCFEAVIGRCVAEIGDKKHGYERSDKERESGATLVHVETRSSARRRVLLHGFCGQ
jgi:hypothetical protein